MLKFAKKRKRIHQLGISLKAPLATNLKQKVSECDEGGPVVRFGAPALQHDVVNVLRAVVRFAQPLGLHVHLVKDLRHKDIRSFWQFRIHITLIAHGRFEAPDSH